MKVVICRSPGDYTTKPPEKRSITTDKISGVKWDDVSGGVQARQGQYYLYGYVDYEIVKEMELCSGEHSFGYNEAKICLIKKENTGEYLAGYNKLAALAGSKPLTSTQCARREGRIPCTKQILKILTTSGEMSRMELRAKILKLGYEAITFCSAIKALLRSKKIYITGKHYREERLGIGEKQQAHE